MNENKSKRKDWVKNFAIIFLTILLILTFFSQTIMNYSLPQVATQYVSNGNITTRIRGTGTVEAVDPYSVILGGEDPETVSVHKINKLAVQVGDIVEKGDVLLYLDEKANSALEEAQKAVEEAQAAYEMALLAEDVNASVISQANNSFDAEKYSQQIIQAQNDVEAQQKVVDDLENTIAAFELQISITGSESQNTVIANAQKAVNNAQKAQAEAPAKLADAQSKLEMAEGELQTVTDEWTVANSAYEAAVAEGKSQEELDVLKSTADTVQVKVTDAQKKVTDAQKVVDDAQKALDNAPTVLAEAQNNLESAKIDQQNSLLNLNQQLGGYQIKKREADNLLAEKQVLLATLTGNKNAIVSLKDAKEAFAQAKAAWEKAKEEDIDSIVVADVSGTITSIKFKSGESVSTGEEVMVIQPAGQGYTMSVSVTTEQARKVQVGDTAELVNNWWYEDMKVVLRSIRPDSSDPAKKKLLVFSIDGDVSEGQSLTVSIGERSANYEYVVPNSAIREDNNGKFILIVESKSSPLGNRYIASRVDVQVVASDDTQSAVTGALQGYEFVITTSTHPINAGQLVRLAEN